MIDIANMWWTFSDLLPLAYTWAIKLKTTTVQPAKNDKNYITNSSICKSGFCFDDISIQSFFSIRNSFIEKQLLKCHRCYVSEGSISKGIRNSGYKNQNVSLKKLFSSHSCFFCYYEQFTWFLTFLIKVLCALYVMYRAKDILN